jgi:putative membrane protein
MFKNDKKTENHRGLDQAHHYFEAERMVLMNERTLLSYVRTALTLVIAGTTFVKFISESQGVVALGWLLIGCGLTTFGVGVYSYIKARSVIKVGEDYVRRHVSFHEVEP